MARVYIFTITTTTRVRERKIERKHIIHDDDDIMIYSKVGTAQELINNKTYNEFVECYTER